MAKPQKATLSLTLENMNPNIKIMEYAVRGPLVIRANEIANELSQGQGVSKPYTDVVRANIGDSHAMGQAPITFIRQVLALVTYPPLMNSSEFPEDAKSRAKEILDGCSGNCIGSYSDSIGIKIVRKHVETFIEKRDSGVRANYEDIILTSGASAGIRVMLEMLNCQVNGKQPAVMVPIPQYPLYSAVLAQLNMVLVGYYLDESKNWGLDIEELSRAIEEAKKNHLNIRAIVVINPGNPTGQVLSMQNIQEIVEFAFRENLFIFADEVYQDNIYAEDKYFHSFKKVMFQKGEPYSKMELVSFMSCSKGYMGECGLRGGYMEVINMDPAVKAMLLKCLSAQLCPTTLGQACLDVVVNPPQVGEPSYEKFCKEKEAVLASFGQRAKLVSETLNSFMGFSCNPVEGAMYAFPQIILPSKAMDAAKKAGKAADTFYAFELLERCGICVVPGTGFGQRPGTYHFRTTILPQICKLKDMLIKFSDFHKQFTDFYTQPS